MRNEITLTDAEIEARFDAIGYCCAVEDVTFTRDTLADFRVPRIMALLMELPEEFRASGAGGWSFLNACNDRHGRQWTGLHSVMDALLTLGIASGQARVLLPREMWSVLPGGVPYFAVLDATPAAEAA